MWHWCCAEWKSEKVTCLACWIYTGTLWHKELLSELTERRLGMWVVYIHIEHCVHYVFFVLREFGALLWTILANHKVKSERVFSVAGNIVTPKTEGLTELIMPSEVQHAAAEAIWNQHVDCLILWTLFWNLNWIHNKILEIFHHPNSMALMNVTIL